jgi:tetratricopeptide (TPR) repeat protein
LIEEGECHRQLREYDGAAKCAAEAKALAKSDAMSCLQIQYFEATLLISQEKREEALDMLSKLLRDHPNDLTEGEGRELYEQIQVQRSFTLMHLERYADASPLLEEARLSSYPPGAAAKCFAIWGVVTLHLDVTLMQESGFNWLRFLASAMNGLRHSDTTLVTLCMN